MNLFSQIEGLSGENLLTGSLRFLVLRSPEIREVVLRLFSDHSPVGPVVSSSHFSCYTEYATADAQSGSGRIDLVLEVDDCVVGIEAKLHSCFQPDQPQKYLATLEDLKASIGKIRRTDARFFLAVVAPKSRTDEVKKKIQDLESVVSVTWEEILERLRKMKPLIDPVAEVARSQFADFLKEKVGFISDFQAWVPHLRRRFDPGGTTLQQKLVSKLWELFPNPGKRLGSSATWVGYYFHVDQGPEHGWYGFVPKKELKSEEAREAELIIATSYDQELDAGSFRRVTLANPNFIGRPGETSSWIVEFNESWNSAEPWRKALQPFIEHQAAEPNSD